jgi:multiple sugar transport system permease protein
MRDLRNGLLFISPWILGFSIFLAYPIGASLYYSLCDFSVLQPPHFVGLANYRELLVDDVFHKALWNTVAYALGAIPLGILVAFSLAMLLNTGVPGMTVFRTIFFLPSLVPSVAMAILWLWIFNGKSGVLNYVIGEASRPVGWVLLGMLLCAPVLLGWLLARSGGEDLRARRMGWMLGLGAGTVVLATLWNLGVTGSLTSLVIKPPSWLSDTAWVKPALIFMSLWGVGHAVVIYLAGLQGVPVHLYEAADLDGANWWQKTRHVTIPMVSPVILFNGIMAIIGTFNFFAIPYVMAPGGQPARSAYFLAVNLFDNAFLYLRMGYAAAMAWVLFIIVFLLTMAAMKLSARHVHYSGS